MRNSRLCFPTPRHSPVLLPLPEAPTALFFLLLRPRLSGNRPDSSHPVLFRLCCCSSVLFLWHHAESHWWLISCLPSSPKTSILFSRIRSQEILVKLQGERKVAVGAHVLVPTSGWSRARGGSKPVMRGTGDQCTQTTEGGGGQGRAERGGSLQASKVMHH